MRASFKLHDARIVLSVLTALLFSYALYLSYGTAHHRHTKNLDRTYSNTRIVEDAGNGFPFGITENLPRHMRKWPEDASLTVCFIHGHHGDQGMANGINYWANDKTLRSSASSTDSSDIEIEHHRWLSVDFLGWPVALHPQVVMYQADYLSRALSNMVSSKFGTKLALVAHSYGGIVALEALSRHPHYLTNATVVAMIFLNSPMRGHPLLAGPTYKAMENQIWWRFKEYQRQFCDPDGPCFPVPMISVTGGFRDNVVPAEFTEIPKILRDMFPSLHLNSEQMWDVHTSADHMDLLFNRPAANAFQKMFHILKKSVLHRSVLFSSEVTRLHAAQGAVDAIFDSLVGGKGTNELLREVQFGSTGAARKVGSGTAIFTSSVTARLQNNAVPFQVLLADFTENVQSWFDTSRGDDFFEGNTINCAVVNVLVQAKMDNSANKNYALLPVEVSSYPAKYCRWIFNPAQLTSMIPGAASVYSVVIEAQIEAGKELLEIRQEAMLPDTSSTVGSLGSNFFSYIFSFLFPLRVRLREGSQTIVISNGVAAFSPLDVFVKTRLLCPNMDPESHHVNLLIQAESCWNVEQKENQQKGKCKKTDAHLKRSKFISQDSEGVFPDTISLLRFWEVSETDDKIFTPRFGLPSREHKGEHQDYRLIVMGNKFDQNCAEHTLYVRRNLSAVIALITRSYWGYVLTAFACTMILKEGIALAFMGNPRPNVAGMSLAALLVFAIGFAEIPVIYHLRNGKLYDVQDLDLWDQPLAPPLLVAIGIIVAAYSFSYLCNFILGLISEVAAILLYAGICKFATARPLVSVLSRVRFFPLPFFLVVCVFLFPSATSVFLVFLTILLRSTVSSSASEDLFSVVSTKLCFAIPVFLPMMLGTCYFSFGVYRYLLPKKSLIISNYLDLKKYGNVRTSDLLCADAIVPRLVLSFPWIPMSDQPSVDLKVGLLVLLWPLLHLLYLRVLWKLRCISRIHELGSSTRVVFFRAVVLASQIGLAVFLAFFSQGSTARTFQLLILQSCLSIIFLNILHKWKVKTVKNN